MYLLLGDIHYCPWTSFSLFMAISTVTKMLGRESPGCNANIQIYLFKNMKGYPLAIHGQSKKLVAYYYCLFISSDLPINEAVFRKVDQREKFNLLLLLSERIFMDELCFCQKRCLVTVFAKARLPSAICSKPI